MKLVKLYLTFIGGLSFYTIYESYDCLLNANFMFI